MTNTLLDTFSIWTSAQGLKSQGRAKSLDNISLEGIARLRELILELAVTGKLVPQNPIEEPASVLLERITEEKEKLIREGKVKRQKALLKINSNEEPFILPEGWMYIRLNEICELVNGDRSKNYPNKSALVARGIPFINAGHLISGKINLDDMNFITPERFNILRSGKIQTGDILYCLRGSLGKTAIVDNLSKGAIASSLVIVRSFFDRINGYLFKYFNSPLSFHTMRKYDNGTAQPNLSATDLAKFIIPLPPLEEQHRIVAKVEELMALCDQLEQQETNHLKTHQLLVETLLNNLTQVADAQELQSAWQRLEAHFDSLFITEESVDLLKQTILQLAVMGRMVPQDPEDEPASVLLEKIADEKEKLVKEGKIKRQKPLPEIREEEKPFVLPERWEWARLNDAIDVRDGTHDSPKDAFGPNTYPLVTSKDFNNGDIDFDSARRISESDHFEISKRSLVEKYDILFSMIGGNLGNQVMVMVDHPFSVKNVALFKYYNRELTLPHFIKKYLENLAMNLQSQAIGGAQPFVSLGYLRNLLIALPPINEQRRIVDKTNELCTLCDQLKERIAITEEITVKMAEGFLEVTSME